MKKTKLFTAFCIAGLISVFSTAAFAAAFSDITPNDACYSAVSDISKYGIVKGYTDGSFRPNNNVTKAELSVMIAGMTPYDTFDAERFPQLFSDVTIDHWAYAYISKAAYCGAFSTFTTEKFDDKNLGTTAATIPHIENPVFSPDSYATYGEAVKAVTTILGYNGIAEKHGGYPSGYLFVGNSFGFTNGIREYGADEYITRADFAILAKNALDIHWCVANTSNLEEAFINENIDYIKFDGYLIYSKLNDNTLRHIISDKRV